MLFWRGNRKLRIIGRLLSNGTSNFTSIDSHLNWLVESPSKLSSQSLKRLQSFQKPSVRMLIPELTNENELGYKPQSGMVSKGTLVDFVVEQKKLHPDKLILVRVGEFYETYGIDALMMIEYAGLNPMGNKPRAGCPIKNIQQTLNHLSDHGLIIAVYEEVNLGNLGNHTDLKKGKIKHRILSQIISQASPMYTYDLGLSDSLDFRESRPALGVNLEASGYSLCQIYVDEKSILIRDKLPFEALKTIINTSGYLEPIYVSQSLKGKLSNELGVSEEVLGGLGIDPRGGNKSFSQGNFHHKVLQRVGNELGVTVEDFREINHTSRSTECLQPQPLYLSTALEIGILSNHNVPSLIRCLLPSNSSTFSTSSSASASTSASAKYLGKLLISPPPHSLAQHFRSILQILSSDHLPLPKMTPTSVGKIVTLLSASRCNAISFREMAENMSGVKNLLTISCSRGQRLSESLLELVAYESGVTRINSTEFLTRVNKILSLLTKSISPFTQTEQEFETPVEIPDEFLRRNESSFQGIFVKGYDEDFDSLLTQLKESVMKLNETIVNDLKELTHNIETKKKAVEVVYDPINNLLAFKSVSKTITLKQFKEKEFFHPMDRNFQPISNKFTSTSTSNALFEYLRLCSAAETKAEEMMRGLCRLLYRDVLTIVQSSHCATIFQCAYDHTTNSIQRGWILPTMVSSKSPSRVFHVEGLFPYWMNHLSAVKNDLTLSDVILLTAPNMAGKSTLMRAVLVTALLANCGLFVPCSRRALIPEYDSYFLRTSSFDIPSEGKSSFAVEMSDLKAIMRDTSKYSLVMLDEIGRGTSMVDGASLSGAILEWMKLQECHGIFSTHILELLHLPLKTQIKKMRMGVDLKEDLDPVWTYKIEEGSIEDSMAFETAKQFGVCQNLIQRAVELKSSLTNHQQRSIKFNSNQPSLPPQSQSGEKYSVETLREVTQEFLDHLPDLRRYLISSSVTIIPAGFLPPPSLERSSCVYILILKPSCESRGEGSNPQVTLYVGETDSLSTRLQSHRTNRVFSSYLSCPSHQFDSLVLQVRDKSSARALESLLIGALAGRGYDLCTQTDHWHTRFSLVDSSDSHRDK